MPRESGASSNPCAAMSRSPAITGSSPCADDDKPGADGCRLLRGFDVDLLVRRHAQAGEIGQGQMQELGLLLRGEGAGLASVDIDRGERSQRLTVDRT